MLSRRIPARFLGAGGFVVLAAASLLTIVAADHPTMFASMILFGMGIGSSFLMQSYIWAAYFGCGHLGGIRGAVMPLTLVQSSWLIEPEPWGAGAWVVVVTVLV